MTPTDASPVCSNCRIVLNRCNRLNQCAIHVNSYNIVEENVTVNLLTRKDEKSIIFVLDVNKKPLSPCHPAKARKLLKQNKAKILKKYPFTIILNKKIDNKNKNTYRLKVDYGSKNTGLAILKNNQEVVWMAQIKHRLNIKNKLDKRRNFRRRRRYKNLRYRQPRFLNRKFKKGWIPPSLESRVNNIKTWVNRLQKLIPITHISYENVKFDTQLMRNPEISGIEYQQGVLQGYEVREYLLEKFNRRCCYCGKQNIPLQIEHIIPKSRGGTNRVDNLCLACKDCNDKKYNMTAVEFGYPEIQIQVKQTLKDCAIINATRWKVYDVLCNTDLPVECGTGARTKMNRIKLDLLKDHHYDACCIGKSTPDKLYFKTNNVLYIKAIGRGNHCRTTINKYGFPRGYKSRQKYFYGFQTGDMVKVELFKGKYKGIWFGEVVCRKRGEFDVRNKNGKKFLQGINYKYFKLIQRTNGYGYCYEKENNYDKM